MLWNAYISSCQLLQCQIRLRIDKGYLQKIGENDPYHQKNVVQGVWLMVYPNIQIWQVFGHPNQSTVNQTRQGHSVVLIPAHASTQVFSGYRLGESSSSVYTATPCVMLLSVIEWYLTGRGSE